MKRRRNFSRLIVEVALVMALLPVAAAQGAKVRMPDFSDLADKAKESVDISLEGEQLKSAGSFLGGGRGNDPQVNQVLAGLQGIFIKAFEFDKPGQYSMRDIDNVLRQVERDGWKKLLSMREDDERVDLWMRDNRADGGMLLVVSESTELVVINIVGNVNLQTLGQLQGRMGIPHLPGIVGPAVPAAAPYAPAPPKSSVPRPDSAEAAARAREAGERAREAGEAAARASEGAQAAARQREAAAREREAARQEREAATREREAELARERAEREAARQQY